MKQLTKYVARKFFTNHDNLKNLYNYDAANKQKLKNCPVCDKDESFLKSFCELDRYGFNVKTSLCKNCGLVFVNPRIDFIEYNNFYNDGHYRRLIDGISKVPKSSYDIIPKRLLSILDIIVDRYQSKSISILDIGGMNKIFSYLNEKITISEYLCINPGKGESDSTSPKFRVENTTLEEFRNDEEKRYDLIIMFGTISHLMLPNVVFNKISSLLSDEGVFIFDFKDTIKRMLNVNMPFQYLHFDHPMSFSADSIKYLITDTSLEISEVIEQSDTLSYYILSKAKGSKTENDHINQGFSIDFEVLDELATQSLIKSPMTYLLKKVSHRLFGSN
jgi:hypothetical protein